MILSLRRCRVKEIGEATEAAARWRAEGFFRARRDQIVDRSHPPPKLATTIDRDFPLQRFGAVYAGIPGRTLLPRRLMAGRAILKHMHDLSDEALCDRWIENPYFQLFCGEEFFQHKLTFDRSSLTRWRPRMGEALSPYGFGVKVSAATTPHASKGDRFVRHVRALASTPCDGHTLAVVVPERALQIGATLKRLTTVEPSSGIRRPIPARAEITSPIAPETIPASAQMAGDFVRLLARRLLSIQKLKLSSPRSVKRALHGGRIKIKYVG